MLQAVDPEKYPRRSDFVSRKSWSEFLDLVSVSRPNYLGLLNPFHVGCDPCTYHYDAVVKMESFTPDARYLAQPQLVYTTIHFSGSS